MLKRWLVTLGLLVLSVSVLALGVWLWKNLQDAHVYAGVVSNPPQMASNISLIDETGNPFSLQELRGQWILLTYGYTSCPDVCPLTLSNLRDTKLPLGADADRVRVVFVSIDPKRDTPAVLKTYVSHFGSDFKGLTGSADEVDVAAKAYNVRYEIKPDASGSGYLVSHSAFVYLIDPQFRLRVTYPFGVQPQDIAGDIAYLLGHETPAAENSDTALPVTEAWLRAPLTPNGDTAAYMVIQNTNNTDDQLISVTSDIAKTIELHETMQMNGMMEMEPRNTLTVPANGKLELKPGGAHMMLLGVTRTLRVGDKVTLRLNFASGNQVTVTAIVRE